MSVLIWVLAIIAVYFFLIFLLTRLVVPFMSFKGFEKPERVPEEIKGKISELENKSREPMSYLQAVYDLVLHKTLHQWKHSRFKAGIMFPRAFVKDLREIWQTNRFLYCTGINYLIYVMLINSRFFKHDDIKVRHVFVNFFIHQYLQVKVGDKWVGVDPAGTGIRGKPLGEHLSFFG